MTRRGARRCSVFHRIDHGPRRGGGAAEDSNALVDRLRRRSEEIEVVGGAVAEMKARERGASREKEL